jgi:heme-binding protein
VKKIITVFVVLILLGAQFIRPTKNQTHHFSDQDLFERHPAPDSVRRLVNQACYDCHSNNTRYPWYAEIQPVGWWLADHVKEGKGELNFSEFGTYSAKRQAHKLNKASEELDEGTMPLKSYTWIHRDARLTPAQRTLLEDWFDATGRLIQPEIAEPATPVQHEVEP